MKALPWSVQVPGRPVGEVATPIAEWLLPQEETALTRSPEVRAPMTPPVEQAT
ncbi:hypothetical protein OH768_35930 [Streptomyces sp. NBC_01622]|nr:hypothetical protein OH768_35930 [Streptomyces sp. NBC_01622]